MLQLISLWEQHCDGGHVHGRVITHLLAFKVKTSGMKGESFISVKSPCEAEAVEDNCTDNI